MHIEENIKTGTCRLQNLIVCCEWKFGQQRNTVTMHHQTTVVDVVWEEK
jgi:hypothetical protein